MGLSLNRGILKMGGSLLVCFSTKPKKGVLKNNKNNTTPIYQMHHPNAYDVGKEGVLNMLRVKQPQTSAFGEESRGMKGTLVLLQYS